MDTVKRKKTHEESFDINVVCRNLIQDLETEDKENQNLQVYLRLKVNGNFEENCYTIDNDKIISRAPKTSNTYKSNANSTKSVFTFTKIFDGDSTQQEIFENVALDPIRDFLNGKNSLIFSYGTTSSGKTYTIQGNAKNVGMVPRTFDSLFNSVNLVDEKYCLLKPTQYSSVNQLTQAEYDNLIKDKKTLLKQAASLNEDNLASLISCNDESDIKMLLNMVQHTGHREQASSKLSLDTAQVANSSFSLWVSFSEIYNENVFDLLDVSNYAKVTSKNAPLKRKKLDLCPDKHGAIFVKNLTQIPVFTSDEAYSLLLLGKSIQHVASTRLNQSSSRSHTVFTITAIRHVTSDNSDPQRCCFSAPDSIKVSKLNFCDLAGSERTKKAHTDHADNRFKEATKINASLLTLGRCIEILRLNQLHPNRLKVVPYRESKLTRLFQSFFCGRGRARMIVNVSQDPNLFDESQQALRFSAICQEVNIPEEIERHPIGRRSRYQRLGLLTPAPGERVSIDWETTIADQMLTDDLERTLEETQDFSKEEYEQIIHDLREEVITLKRKMEEQDWEIRQEVCEDFQRHIQEMEEQFEEQMREYKQDVENESEKRLQLYLEAYDNMKPKKRKIQMKSADNRSVLCQQTMSEDSDILLKLTEEIKHANEKIRELEQNLADQRETADYLAKEKDSLEAEVSRLHFNIKELSQIHDESKSQPVCGTPKSHPGTPHFNDSDAPTTVVKKKFFEDPSYISNQSKRIDSIIRTEKSVIDSDQLKEQNQKLLAQLTDLQDKLKEEVRQKQAFFMETSQLKSQLESQSMRYSVVDSSFLRHEKEVEQEEQNFKANQLELRVRELEAQLTEKIQLEKEVAELKEDIKRTRQVSADELTSKGQEFGEYQKSLLEKDKKMQKSMKEKADTDLENNSLKRKLNDATTEINQLTKSLKKLKDEYKTLKTEANYMKSISTQNKQDLELAQTDIRLKTDEIDMAERKLVKVCDELSEKTKSLMKSEQQNKELSRKLETEKMTIQSLERRLTNSQSNSELESLQKQLSEKESELTNLRHELECLKFKNTQPGKYFDEESNDSSHSMRHFSNSILNDEDDFREPLPPKRVRKTRQNQQQDDSMESTSRVLRNTRSKSRKK